MSDEATNIPRVPNIPPDVSNTIVLTTLDKLYNWGRKNSAWPLAFGLACCAIEMMCTWGARNDVARFGWEWMRPSPRQADLMIVSGTVTKKMVPQIVRLYNQMPEPRYVLAMGACATSGGPFKEGYSVVWGIDKFVPVDVYITGCPPRPEALLHGIIKLREKIERQTIRTVPWYRRDYEGYVPIPTLGPDLVDARRLGEIAEKSQSPAAAASALRGANHSE
jgi:NADH-quinone oxidoreductase subunit B